MSYHGGGHRRRQYRGEDTTNCAEGDYLNLRTSSGGDDYGGHDHRRDNHETPEQKLRKSIINLGEVVRFNCDFICEQPFKGHYYRQDPIQELTRLANDLRAANNAAAATGGSVIPAITEGFRIGSVAFVPMHHTS